jgi:hypothetical protein
MVSERRLSDVEIDHHDEDELANFGYKQELKRDWGLMHNFGISFSIIVSLRILGDTIAVSNLNHSQ